MANKTPQKALDRERAVYHYRKDNRLCVACGQPLPDDRNATLCLPCAKKHTAIVRQGREIMKQRGRCILCRKEDAFTMNGRALCAECAEKNQRRLSTPEMKAYVHKYNTERHARLTEAHICTWCGIQMPEDYEYTRCPKCRTKQLILERARRTPKWNDPDLCSRCHKEPPIEGKKLCKACYEKALRAIERANAAVDRTNHPWRQD